MYPLLLAVCVALVGAADNVAIVATDAVSESIAGSLKDAHVLLKQHQLERVVRAYKKSIATLENMQGNGDAEAPYTEGAVTVVPGLAMLEPMRKMVLALQADEKVWVSYQKQKQGGDGAHKAAVDSGVKGMQIRAIEAYLAVSDSVLEHIHGNKPQQASSECSSKEATCASTVEAKNMARSMRRSDWAGIRVAALLRVSSYSWSARDLSAMERANKEVLLLLLKAGGGKATGKGKGTYGEDDDAEGEEDAVSIRDSESVTDVAEAYTQLVRGGLCLRVR